MDDRTNGMEPANEVLLLLIGQIGPVAFHICTCCAITADMLRGERMNKTQAHTHIHMYNFQSVKGSQSAALSFLFSMTHPKRLVKYI